MGSDPINYKTANSIPTSSQPP